MTTTNQVAMDFPRPAAGAAYGPAIPIPAKASDDPNVNGKRPPTSTELLALVAKPVASGMDLGQAHYLRQRARDAFAGPELEMVNDWITDTAAAPAVYGDPTKAVTRLSGKPQPLTESDRAWLSRLPADPAKISDSKVRQLVQLQTRSEMNSGDRRLLDSILAPVAAYHARRNIETQLDGLKSTPMQRTPASAVAAVAKAIRRETPNLTEGEALDRARQALTTVAAQRTEARNRAIAYAEMKLREARAAEVDAA